MFNCLKKLLKFKTKEPEIKIKIVKKTNKSIFASSYYRYSISKQDLELIKKFIEITKVDLEGKMIETYFSPKCSDKQLKPLFYREYDIIGSEKQYQVVTQSELDKNSYFERTISYNNDLETYNKTYETHCKESSIYNKQYTKEKYFKYSDKGFIIYFNSDLSIMYIDFLIDDDKDIKENLEKINNIIKEIQETMKTDEIMKNAKLDIKIEKSI